MEWAVMVVAIVLIVTVGKIIRAKAGVRRDKWGNEHSVDTGANAAEARRLQDEVRTLKDRIAVLERVITDNHSASNLDREIEKLRDERN
jgi:hypothetical protein